MLAKFASFIVLAGAVVALSSCQSTSTGIGTKAHSSGASSLNNFNTEKVEGVEVLDLPFKEAVDLALEAAQRAYGNSRLTTDGTKVYIENRDFWQGDARALIDPILVKENKSEALGIIYEVKSEGFGGNFSMMPGYVTTRFFSELTKLKDERSITTKLFSDFTKLKIKGVAERISPSIPTTFASFASYIDSKSERFPKEGIWEFEDGKYTLGIVRDKNDLRYPYKAFIIESKERAWKAGEVKIKFSKLDESGIAAARYFSASKVEYGMTFESSESALIALTPKDLGVILIKTYPRDQSDQASGSGSSWHIGNGYFVTNAHVISGAKSIKLLVNGKKLAASAISVDEKLDLAILKIEGGFENLNSIPLASGVSSGESVFAIGYPLGSLLGTEPKISDGIVGALTGIGGDPTVMTVTTPIQPGNSGGPVLNEYGEVVGVIAAKLRDKASSDSDVENLNYAVKVNYLLPLVANLQFTSLAKKEKLSNVCAKYCDAVFYVETK